MAVFVEKWWLYEIALLWGEVSLRVYICTEKEKNALPWLWTYFLQYIACPLVSRLHTLCRNTKHRGAIFVITRALEALPCTGKKTHAIMADKYTQSFTGYFFNKENSSLPS